jgi:beta-galactosidase
VIVGVDNGNPASVEPYKASSRKAFSGKCLVIVQATKHSGTITITANSNGLASDSVTIEATGGIPEPTPVPRSAFTQIEAENYNSQSGIQTEDCSEGGKDVGYIENGDYVVYKAIDFGAGAASFKVRVASATDGGNIELRLGSINGSLVGTCSVTGTGGWQEWDYATCEVTDLSGIHDLYLVFTGGEGYLFNVNWFIFEEGNITGHLGDVNGDGSIDSTDLQLLKRHVLNKKLLEGTGLLNADVNKDKSVDSTDVTLLKRYILRKISSFDN